MANPANPIKKFLRKLKDLKKKRRSNKRKTIRIVINPITILLVVFVVFGCAQLVKSFIAEPDSNVISYSELIQKLEKKEVKSIVIMGNKAEVELKNPTDNTKLTVVIPPDKNPFGENGSMEGYIKNGEVELIYKEGTILTLSNIISLLFIAVIIWSVRSTKGKIEILTKNPSKIGKVNISFKDIGGLEEEKQELSEVVEFLKNPEKFKQFGARMPKGVLLIGPPGTGKTLMAKAVSGEADVPFYSMSGSDFTEMYAGVGASKVKNLFKDAKKNSPCIVFIDEIDSIGSIRSSASTDVSMDYQQTLNKLLTAMDGFDTTEGIVMLAATNRPEILDPALLRPGRFDRHITIGSPDIKAREIILRLHCANKPVDLKDQDYSILARETAGLTGASLENIVNEAALLAMRRGKEIISISDIKDAVIKVTIGLEKKNSIISEEEKRFKAYHEAGHTVATCLLSSVDSVQQVSIIPRGGAGGYTMYGLQEEKQLPTKKDMLDYMTILIAGRAAEEMMFNDITVGAQNDMERATEIAADMVTKYGMSKLGPRSCISKGTLAVSERMRERIDKEVDKLIGESYKAAKELIENSSSALERIAQALLEREKLESNEIKELMA